MMRKWTALMCWCVIPQITVWLESFISRLSSIEWSRWVLEWFWLSCKWHSSPQRSEIKQKFLLAKQAGDFRRTFPECLNVTMPYWFFKTRERSSLGTIGWSDFTFSCSLGHFLLNRSECICNELWSGFKAILFLVFFPVFSLYHQ